MTLKSLCPLRVLCVCGGESATCLTLNFQINSLLNGGSAGAFGPISDKMSRQISSRGRCFVSFAGRSGRPRQCRSLIFVTTKALTPEQAQTSDSELLHAIARGDEQALASLYDRYRLILFGLILRILHSRPEAEDILQDVFIQVWRRAADFDESRGRAFTWLVTLARSRTIDRLRALESRQRTANEAVQAVPDSVSDSETDALRSEQREAVRACLQELPAEQRQTLVLAYFEGLTQTEIAARLEAPLGTVKTRMRSGMIKLREMLGERMKDFL
jgi:RNA polymerase sigma-70 factor, ECF subfamily